MQQAMGRTPGWPSEMARLQHGLRSARARSAVGRSRQRMRRRRSRWATPTRPSALAELGRPRPARRDARPGLSRRQPRRHRRGAASSARSGARPSTTWRSCDGSSASCASRATSQRGSDGLKLTPRGAAPARRDRAAPGLRRGWRRDGRGGHDVRDAGAAGEITGASREWQFGDEQPLDVVRTVRNAVLRTAAPARRSGSTAEDFEVVETERRSSAPPSPCSSTCRTRWSCAARGARPRRRRWRCTRWSRRSTRRTRSRSSGSATTPGCCRPATLVEHDWDRVQGTNLQHGLMLARRHLDKHRDAEPVILVDHRR